MNSRPLGAGSDRQRARKVTLDDVRKEVRSRAHGRCEWPGCRNYGTDLAHAQGRGNRVSAELADTALFTWWACRSHHDVYDLRRPPVDPTEKWVMEAFQDELMDRAAAAWGVEVGSGWAPVDVAREIERKWRADGRAGNAQEEEA